MQAGGVYLKPISASDEVWLREAELSPFLAFRWRHHGMHLPPAEYSHHLWAGVLAQFAILHGDNLLGLSVLYGADFANGHCKMGIAKFRDAPDLRVMTGALLTINYGFQGWPFRKIYLEMAEYNFPQIASGAGTVFSEEGRLTEHIFLDGIYWDVLILALKRDPFLLWSEKWLSRAAR